ncbi:MAG: cyclic 2,3-diphosphoglycerate synthase [Candidatus Diapherotrites archaeon]|nr:cyclic 2,3-diphosphoglycerate synthase [Candidatus Diapherotrites archaeon]
MRKSSKRRVIIIGAAGRDFHNFNVFFRNNSHYEVVAFTAAQISGIENRVYPSKLAGKGYPKGIPIFPQARLAELIKKFCVSDVIFAYSDVTHEEVMHLASIALSCKASFTILGPGDTAIKSNKLVIAVTATRTGAGKSQTTRRIAEILRDAGKRVVIIRHPMPYGILKDEICERFAKISDLEKFKCTIEEREEYEPLITERFVVYAGVDYGKILHEAEKEADIIINDGGNNDFYFLEPNLNICVTDPFRAGHELLYHPGETNFRMANVILINKVNTAPRESVKIILQNAKAVNPKALVVKVGSEIFAENPGRIKGKRVIAIEDGPSVTHGGLPFGVASIIAKKQKAILANPEKHSVGSIKETFKKFPHLHNILPAMGYGKKQLEELEKTINNTPADFVLSGTPIDLSRILKVNKPIIHVSYSLKEMQKPSLEQILKKFNII